MIRVGDTVTWKSRSYRRTGKVLAIVPAGQNVDKLVPEDEPISHRNYMTICWQVGGGRNSYHMRRWENLA